MPSAITGKLRMAGINAGNIKVATFMISAALAGLAGLLWRHR